MSQVAVDFHFATVENHEHILALEFVKNHPEIELVRHEHLGAISGSVSLTVCCHTKQQFELARKLADLLRTGQESF
jgi:hypothetical protein